jgi:phenylalanine-4-hydroxylase
MGTATKYIAKEMDANGNIAWSDEENSVWNTLITRQQKAIVGKACEEYLHGLDLLQLPNDRIPQFAEVNRVLRRETGWEIAWVPALINFQTFFNLLADKKFPCATFIRTREELDYLQEPDIFHEIFGHCAMLTNPFFADFTHIYGRLGQAASKEDRVYLARLYWFTVEFGVMQSAQGRRVYGGGILSSIGETQYVYSDKPEFQTLDVVNVMRTPYRIDIMQPLYFDISSLQHLFEVSQMDLMGCVQQAKQLGLFAPKYPPKAA